MVNVRFSVQRRRSGILSGPLSSQYCTIAKAKSGLAYFFSVFIMIFLGGTG